MNGWSRSVITHCAPSAGSKAVRLIVRQAGVKAFERSVNREAASAFEQALAVIDHLPQTRETIEQTVDLCLAMRPCITPLADMKRLLATVERAAPLIASLGNPRREALVNGYHAGALTNLGRTQEALALARRGLSIANSHDDPLLRISSHFFMGQTQNRIGAFREAIKNFESDFGLSTDRLIELATGQSTTGGTLDAKSALTSLMFTKAECSFVFVELGEFNNAISRAKEVQQLAQSVGLVYFHALAEMACGAAHVCQGETSVAIPFLERSLRLGDDADFPGAVIHAAWALGHAYNLSERGPEAVVLLERAWGLAESGGFLHFGAICLMNLADAYSLTGQDARARETIERALAVVRDAGYRALEARALHFLAKILGQGPETAAAQQAYQDAIAIALELGMRPLIAHCHLGMGKLDQRRGHHSEARAGISEATELYREMDMHFFLKQAESGLQAIG